MTTNVILETERLILRELVPSDAEGMFALDSDPEVHRYLGNKPVQHINESIQMIAFIREQYEQYGIGRWAVMEKETQAFIGWSGLKFITEPINGHSRYYDVGYRLLRKYWGKGYAFESAWAAVAYGFNTMHLREIVGIVEVGNTASENILNKLGLSYVEHFELAGAAMKWYQRINPAMQ